MQATGAFVSILFLGVGLVWTVSWIVVNWRSMRAHEQIARELHQIGRALEAPPRGG